MLEAWLLLLATLVVSLASLTGVALSLRWLFQESAGAARAVALVTAALGRALAVASRAQ